LQKELDLRIKMVHIERFIDYFSDRHIEETDTTVTLTEEEMIKLKLKKGDKTDLENILTKLLN